MLESSYLLLQKIIRHIFAVQTKFVIFETLKVDEDNYKTYIFLSPKEEIVLTQTKNVKNFFDKLEYCLKNGRYLAGFFSYELGYFLDYKPLNEKQYNLSFPLAFFYVFGEPIVYNHKTNQFENISSNLSWFLNTTVKKIDKRFSVSNIRLNVTKNEYVEMINKIKNYIYNGDTYQVNFTVKTKFDFSGSLLGLYEHLKQTQKVSYTAVLQNKDFTILSFSPEMFFRKVGDKIWFKPMKGTMFRGRNLEEDKLQVKKLYSSVKNRAENVMIVDLIRNDIGKLADYGTVKVEKLFEIEQYETLFQMTSTISAKIKPDISLYKLFRSVFPSGSVTGAPKIRTMQIIKETEKEPRKVYTGSIGFFTPQKDAVFNVAIRTILINKNGKGELGIGSGIVADSHPEKEFEECKLKSLFFVKKQPRFRLIETILYCSEFDSIIKDFYGLELNITNRDFQEGFFLLDFHINRLKNSALYFGFRFNEDEVFNKLFSIKSQIDNNENNKFYRIRVLLSKNGKISIEYSKLEKFRFCSNIPAKIVVSRKNVNSGNVFLYHKTTNRKVFNSEYNKFNKLNFFDVLFTNENGYVTECSRCNIVIKKDDRFYTPKVNNGLLPGVFRKFLLNKNDIIETNLKLEDILCSEKIFVTNSIIGIRPAKVVLL